MQKAALLSIVILAAILHAQDGQQGSRPGWPCVAGRAVDPAYVSVSESTGGQLFLFQKNEVAQSSIVMMAPQSHPATVLRAIGNLSGTRDFEFPIDSTVESMLFLVSLQCRNSIRISRPGGSEMTASNSALNVDLQAGRILRIDHPDSGRWRLRITGTGLYVVSVLVKANIVLTGVSFSTVSDASPEEGPVTHLKQPIYGVQQNLDAYLSGEISHPKLQFVDAAGVPISDEVTPQQMGEHAYRILITPQADRFRILVTGTDSLARPFQRVHPVLFKSQPK